MKGKDIKRLGCDVGRGGYGRRDFLRLGAGAAIGGAWFCGCAQQKNDQGGKVRGEMVAVMAFCGLLCEKCPAYIARKNNDDQMRAKMVQIWGRQYGVTKLEDINCDGCHSDSGVLFKHCTTCRIRSCARQKRLASCAYCIEYPCGEIERFPFGKSRLDEIRRQAGVS